MPANTRKPVFARPFAALGAALVASLVVTLTPAFMAPSTAASMSLSTREVNALLIARHHAGDPYEYGASGPQAFDCSGLTHYALVGAGFRNVPRTAAAQAQRAHHIARKYLRRGDLIFFTSGGSIYHVAFFIRWEHGRALILHAPYPGARVRYELIWTNSWFAGTLR
jgi:cell wall-associated NlpC family hydrolase